MNNHDPLPDTRLRQKSIENARMNVHTVRFGAGAPQGDYLSPHVILDKRTTNPNAQRRVDLRPPVSSKVYLTPEQKKLPTIAKKAPLSPWLEDMRRSQNLKKLRDVLPMVDFLYSPESTLVIEPMPKPLKKRPSLHLKRHSFEVMHGQPINRPGIAAVYFAL